MIRPIEISLHTSRQLARILLAAHLLALLIAWALPLNWLLKSGSSLLLLASLAMLKKYLMQPNIVALRVNIKGEFSVQRRGGEWLEVSVLGSSFVMPWLTILHLKIADKREYLVLLPDNLDADDFRRLRVWLRWGIPKN